MEHLQTVRGKYMVYDHLNQKPVTVSNEYEPAISENSDVDGSALEKSLLKTCLYYVHRDSEALLGAGEINRDILFASDRTLTTDYPAPNLFTPWDAEDSISKPRSIVSLLRLTAPKETATDIVSELAVGRLVGSAISGIFNIKDCTVISNQQLIFPKSLWSIKYNAAYPDIACLRDGTELKPVLIIGEGKVHRRGMHKTGLKESTGHDVRAQMAAAVHPTMILLVLAYYKDIRDGLQNIKMKPANDKPTEFGHESMVYGVYYDEKEVRILAHFPQLVETPDSKDGQTHGIRFFQVPVIRFNLAEITGNILLRWRMVIALFAVQRHAEMLRDHLQAVVVAYNASAATENEINAMEKNKLNVRA
ncbi:hypothetical protein C8J57DRAFT_1627768 [Mycena rebaudengoi]|nr:hypothetical protein C8J57DRAFT_1627768 [Mycena rebaudengoi]